MIDFNCPHCGNHFRVSDDLAGRSGWCKVCKGLLMVPRAGEPIEAPHSPETRVKELEAYLRASDERFRANYARYKKIQTAARDLQERHAALQADYEAREALLQAQDATVSSLKSEIAALRTELAQATSALSEARTQVQDGAKERARLEAALADANTSRDALAALQVEYERLERALAESQAACANFETIAEQKRAAEASVAEVSARLSEVQTLLAEREAEAARAREQLDAFAGGSASTNRKLKDLAREVDALSRQLHTEQTQRLELERKLESEQAKHAASDEQLARAREQTNALRTDLEAAVTRESTLAAAQAELVGELRSAQARAVDAEARSSALREELVRAGQACGAAEALVEQSRAEISRLTDELAHLRQARADLEKELRDARVLVGQAEALRQDRDEARRMLRDAELQIERLKVEMAAHAEGSGGAQSRAAQAMLELERVGQALAEERAARITAEKASADSLRLREELVAERNARIDAEKRARQTADLTQELMEEREARLAAEKALAVAAQAQHELERERQLRAEAEKSAREAVLRVEGLESGLADVRSRLDEARHGMQADAGAHANSEVAEVARLQAIVDRLAGDLSEVSRSLGAAEGRAEGLARDVERLAADLAEEIESRQAAEARAESAMARALDAERRAAMRASSGGAAMGVPVFGPRAGDDALTFVPEILPDEDEEDQMMETLLRFIEPE